MEFAVAAPAGVGPGNPALLTARGPDPLFELPAAHFFRRIDGLPLVPVPGALIAVANCVASSWVEAIVGHAVFVVQPATGAASTAPYITRALLPQRFDAVVNQLHSEPPPLGLDPNKRYASPAHAASAVLSVVRGLDLSSLNAAYVLLPGDLYPLEPVPAAAAAFIHSLVAPGSAVTFGSLADNRGSLTGMATLSFSGYGRALSASRDAPQAPLRLVLQQVEAYARATGFLRPGVSLTVAALSLWLQATAIPSDLFPIREVGDGLDRREQFLRDRHNLLFGTSEQKELLIAGLVVEQPLFDRLPNLKVVLGERVPLVDVRLALARLAKGVLGSSARAVSELSVVQNLEVALKNPVRCLSAPGLVGVRLEQRLDAVLRSVVDYGAGASSGGSGSGVGASSSGAASQIKLSLFADELAEAQ